MSIGLILGLGVVVNMLCWLILMRMYDTILSFALGYLCIIPYLVAMIFTIGVITDIWYFLKKSVENFGNNKKVRNFAP